MDDVPCCNCICLPVCKSLIKPVNDKLLMQMQIISKLSPKCSIINDYIKVKDSKGYCCKIYEVCDFFNEDT